MYQKEKNILLAAVDHGFSTMKTPHFIFENGVEEFSLSGKAIQGRRGKVADETKQNGG